MRDRLPSPAPLGGNLGIEACGIARERQYPPVKILFEHASGGQLDGFASLAGRHSRMPCKISACVILVIYRLVAGLDPTQSTTLFAGARFARRQVELNSSERLETFSDGVSQAPRRRSLFGYRGAKYVTRLIFHRAPLTSRSDTQPLLGLFVQITDSDARHGAPTKCNQ